MKGSWTAMAVALCALGVLAGCDDYDNSIQYSTGSTITNLSPSGIPAAPTPPPGAATCQNGAGQPTYACFTIYVVASSTNGFQTNSVVQWNGQKMPTTYIDSTDLSAVIPYSLVAKPGTAYVNTWYPQSGTGQNGLSNALTFIIYGAPNPYPTLSSVSPTSTAYCAYSTTTTCPSVPITLTGSNFLPTSQNGGSSITFTGAATYNTETAITVTGITSTQLKATIPGKYLCASGTAYINVINPPSSICLLNCPNLGGGDTNNPPAGQQATTQTFTITNATSANTCPANVPITPAIAQVTAAINQNGRYVTYPSTQNGTSQIVMRDTCLSAADGCVASTQMISVAADGTAGNADSRDTTVSADGRYVVFSSSASNLVENALFGPQIYLRDTCNGAASSCKPSTMLVSTDPEGKLTGAEAILPSISATGRFVAFLAVTPDQSATPANIQAHAAAASSGGLPQVFLRDTCLGAANCTPVTTRVSLQSGSGSAGASNAASSAIEEETPAVTEDGRYVVYAALENGISQIVLRDTCLGVNSCTPSARTVSAATDDTAGNGDSHNAVITPDGRYVGFSSAASNLAENASAGRQVYLRDTCLGAAASCKASVSLVSTDAEGQLMGTEAILPSISGSGRFVAFLAVTSNQGDAVNGGLRQIFVRDTCLGAASCTPQTTRISLQPADSTAPAGPALAGLGKQIALTDGMNSTVFTATVPIDNGVFLAIPNKNK